MTAGGVSKQKAAMLAECEEKGLAYCKAKAELSFGSRRQALLDWISMTEAEVKAREKQISQTLALQYAEKTALADKKTARLTLVLAIGMALIVALLVSMVLINFNSSIS